MKTQYAPGPWKVEKKDGMVSIKSNENHYLANIVMDFEDREFANARLIAAAPELLKSLQMISGWSECQCHAQHGDNPNCCILVAEQAIAKAEGII